MWNITQPESSTATSGMQTAVNARPASWSQTVGARRSRKRERESGSEAPGGDDEGELDHGSRR